MSANHSNNGDNKDNHLDSRIQRLESQANNAHLKLIEQEHRFISIFVNLIKSYQNGNRLEKVAAWKAFFYLFVPGRTAIIISGGTVIGILTVILMQKNNELVASQNYYLQTQIYYQTKNENRGHKESITRILYDPSPESEEAVKQAYNNGDKIIPLLEAEHHPFTRRNAFAQLISITEDEPVQPEPVYVTSLSQQISTWTCNNFSLFCQYVEVTDSAKSTVLTKEKPILNLDYAFLDFIVWPDVSKVTIKAPFARITNSNLRKAKLQGADLIGANFFKSNLEGADLSNAKLQKAYMVDVKMKQTILTGADLTGAVILCDDIKHAIFDKKTLEGFKCKVQASVPPIVIPPKTEAESFVEEKNRIKDSSDRMIFED